MKQSKLILDKDYIISPIDRRLYGSFIEHLGRAVYTGIYEPAHPLADEQGFPPRRAGFGAQAERACRALSGRKLRLRLPLGGFHRPKEQRPRRLDLAWKTTEPNHIRSA